MPPKNKAAAKPADDEHLPVGVDETASGDLRQAAVKREAALKGRDNDREFVDALLVERRGYVNRGLKDRIAQVDEQIRLRGGEVPED